jgi:chromosome segregation ATPase
MKRKSLCMAGCVLIMYSLCGCATTTDPSKGGFFDGVHGLSSGAYQQRVNDKQENLSGLQSTGAQLRGEQVALNKQADSLEKQEDAYRQQLTQLKDDLSNMQSSLRKARLQSHSKLAQKKKLEERLIGLKGQVQKSEQTSKSGDPQKQQELSRMRAEKEKIQEDILRLTSQ